jgi:hypothetical protein
LLVCAAFVAGAAVFAQGMAPSSGGGFPHTGDAAILNGTLSLTGPNDDATICLTRNEVVDSASSPKFCMGSIVSGGVNLPMLLWLYSDGATAQRRVFIVESSGTVASVSDGTRRSHYEAFLQDGDVDPLFRLSSSPSMTLELGSGGCVVAASSLVRAADVTTATCSTPHTLAVGSTFHLSNSEALFPEVTATTKTVATVPSIYQITYSDTGSNGSSTIAHNISSTTDVHFKRSAANTAQVALGGGAKTTWYPGSFVTEDGIDLYVDNDGTPLAWFSAGYDRVAIGPGTPAGKLHITGTASGESVLITKGASGQTGYLQEWRNDSDSTLAYVGPSGVARVAEISSSLTSVTPIAAATGRDVYYNGDMRRGCYRVAVSDAGWTKPAALTEDLALLSIPAKARITSIVADTLYAYWASGAASITLRVGTTAGGQQLIADHDVFTAAVTKGLADADLGTSINRANAVQGGYIPSWTASTTIYARLTADVNLSGLAAGQTFYYVCVEFL